MCGSCDFVRTVILTAADILLSVVVLLATLAACGASAAPDGTADDAAKMNSGMMNPGRAIRTVEPIGGGGIRVLVYGNSIALHGPKPDIGWTNDWGMAASARGKDFAHLVVAGHEAQPGFAFYVH